MNKEIDLQKIEDPLKDYMTKNYNHIPLEEYSNILTKFQLLRLDENFTPFHIIKGCLSRKNIYKLIILLLKKHPNIKSLNLSGCILPTVIFDKLPNFKNLTSLNLHNSIKIPNNIKVKIFDMMQNEQPYWEEPILREYSWREDFILDTLINKLPKLKLLDISNCDFILEPVDIVDINTLEILSMENMFFMSMTADDIYYEFSKLSNLKELDISKIVHNEHEIKEISKLKNLELLYTTTYDEIIFRDITEFNEYIIDILKLKSLKYLKIYFIFESSRELTTLSKNKLEAIHKGIEKILKLPRLIKLLFVLSASKTEIFTDIDYKTEVETIINGVDVTLNKKIYDMFRINN